MAEEIVMPRLGWTMEEGTLIEWLKEDGAPVAAGDLLFTVESDKALNEVETFAGGVLYIPPDAPRPDDTVPVGTVLAYLLQPGEEKPFASATTAAPPASPPTSGSPSVTAAESAPIAEGATKQNEPAISPRARRVAAELDVDWRQLEGSGQTGRIVERDVRTAAQNAEVPRVTPVARRLAAEAGLDLTELAAAKAGGRIEREDVEAALADRVSLGERQPTTRIRRVIAEHLSASARTTAAVTLTTEADATELATLREKFRDSLVGEAPTYNDLLVKLTAVALGEHPLLNASWLDDEIHLHDQIHLGVAVDTDDGLLVPVIRDARAKSLQQIAIEAQNLAERARQRQLQPEDMRDGTFTITNLGMYGIDAFTPIINLPQCAILGVGRIREKPAVLDGQVVPRSMLALSLTFDHRVVDGGPAARFLDQVRAFVEQPYLWLGG